ncbi:MAG: permease prefix domain 2-containing transporter [Candidatus Acidiferrum sp.]
MPEMTFVLPPRMAVWLVDLFTPNKQNESILGDLLEEFSELASKTGVAFARRWYWRQSIKTVAHLVITGFFDAPWLIACNVVGGWVLWLVAYWITEKSVNAILHTYRVYAHVDAYVFFLIYGVLIELVIEPLSIGCIVAATAKGREMVATMTLSFSIWAMDGVLLARSRHYWPMTNFQLLPLVVAIFVSPVMFVIVGVTARKLRSAISRRASATHC